MQPARESQRELVASTCGVRLTQQHNGIESARLNCDEAVYYNSFVSPRHERPRDLAAPNTAPHQHLSRLLFTSMLALQARKDVPETFV